MMSENEARHSVCVIIGASHAGVNFAFSLRREGWTGEILLFDTDPIFPYHRPPLSKALLTSESGIEKHFLRPQLLYDKEQIQLHLGKTVSGINRQEKSISLTDGTVQPYEKLVLATGARPLIPAIPGIDEAQPLFPIRTAQDALHIRAAFPSFEEKRVVVIGGGYIGLETGASLRKLGAAVTILEREERILARITAPEMSAFFQQLHQEQGVDVLTSKTVSAIQREHGENIVLCSDGSQYLADLIIVGTGILVNTELAEAAGLEIEDGITVDHCARTSEEDIYAIGDCTWHYNPHYDRFVRLESVQNAVEQAKVAAEAICGKDARYDTIPWFWSDQFDVKLQIVGLFDGYTQALVRNEEGDAHRFSIWYFKDDTLLAVDAVNHSRAYMLGTRFLKAGQKVDKLKLVDPQTELKPANLLADPSV